MELLLNVLIGFTFSIAATCPGLSESAIAVMWGVYDKLISNVSNLTSKSISKEEKTKSLVWLLFLGLGFIIGYVVFAKLLSFLMVQFPKELFIVFIGFVLGMIPTLFKNEIIKSKNYKLPKNWIYFISGFCLIVAIVVIKNILHIDTTQHGHVAKSFSIVVDYKLCITLFFVAFISGTALALPGLSGALLMMVLGQYFNIMGMVSNLSHNLIYILPLSCFALGVAFSFALTSKIMKKLLQTHKTEVMFLITGLILGSVFAIYGGLPTSQINLAISVGVSIVMFIIVNYLVSKYSYNH